MGAGRARLEAALHAAGGASRGALGAWRRKSVGSARRPGAVRPARPYSLGRTMDARSAARLGGLAAIVSGVFWGFALPLIATQATDDPVGMRYDDFNRWLTLPLALLVAALAAFRAVQLPQVDRTGRWGAALALALAGTIVMLVGNVVEFWLVIFTDTYVAAIAEGRPEFEEWAGSTVGWLVFLAGTLLLLVGGVLLGVAVWRGGTLPAWTGVVVALTAPLILLAFVVRAISVEATIAVAVVLGLAWIALGLRLRAGPPDDPREAVVR